MGHDDHGGGGGPGCTGCGACGNSKCAGTGGSARSGEDHDLPAPFDLTVLLATGGPAGAQSSFATFGPEGL